ncbi:C39 family peptidase, partial [Methanoregula sp.]|uniref:C39 family peptidase n=1 Tax=Methanoregula sp. TaxID=2052170 RepID=UPI000CB9A301
MPAAATVVPATTTAILLSGVPDVRQAEFYSCGASSFQAVMSYYGLNAMETDLRGILNTSPSHGTYPWDMVRAAQAMGFDAEWKENLSLHDLETALHEGTPVIIDGQRFLDPDSTWDDTWDSGHYMVVIGMDDRNVYLEDPYILGSRLRMTREEFLASWHDYESEIPVPPGATKYY